MSDAAKSQLLEMDLYKMFEVEETSPIELIKKAYRRRALELHPDKNLDANKEEAEAKFVQLGKAFEILADKAARAAYDAVRRARREKVKRDEQLDGKRRKLKEELESREAAARERAEQKTNQMRRCKEEDLLNAEIERLSKVGSRMLDEQISIVNEQVRSEMSKKRSAAAPPSSSSKPEPSSHVKSTPVPRIKVSWSSKEERESSSKKVKLNEELLNYLFAKYGEIDVLVVSKKKSSALLDYKEHVGAIRCMADSSALELSYGISLMRMDSQGKPETVTESAHATQLPPQAEAVSANKEEEDELSQLSFEDMEALVLKRLKTAGK